jgi:hypothetical protein
MEWIKKNKFLLLLIPLTVILIFIIGKFFSFHLKTSVSDEVRIEKGTDINNCNPYEYLTDDIPMQIPSITTEDATIDFHQISNIDANTDKMVDNLYSEYSANLSEGIKDCFPEFDNEGIVRFSRKSSDDNERYQTFLNYIGNNEFDLLLNLNNMPEHRYNNLECVTFQKKNSNVEIVKISAYLYSNVEVNILISKNLSQVKSVYKNNTYQELKKLLNSENASVMRGIRMSNVYHYQQRIFRKDTDNITEEQFIYYTYLKKDDLEYLIQYKSNFTVLAGQKEYMYVGDLQSQEVCRNTLLLLLGIIIDS